MATYLKRTSKLFDLSLSRPSADVNLRDLMCPVCRGILIEPVTLPCTHNLCLRCLKGTFEHNSLSCPLCRIRVGSWLRTATKTETLVNNGLWELIRAKFPKEVEDKYNGDDRDIELDAGFNAANKILSAAGEIRREYEAQLQMAEKEIRCQREAEQMASEALIRKIQAEEQQQQLTQLAQDQLFAKSLAKTQIVKKQKDVPKYFSEHADVSASGYSFDTSKFNFPAADVCPSKRETQTLESGKINLLEVRDGSELRRSNIALISKIRAERYASSMKANAPGIGKDSSSVFCCQKSVPVYNAITRTLKHQRATKTMQPSTSSFVAEPSTSKIYGTQSKEELHVPNDVVNSKKKSLGVEVCMTVADDDGRIGSAESAGSHDSINQEIHHFKPIKVMPRTPLKMSTDGRPIDPKLIRVVPIVKRISNVVPKPPSQAHLNRIVGCSWSAFRGKARQNSREKELRRNPESAEETERGASTSQDQPGPNKPAKSQPHDIIRRLDFVPEMSSDGNKNHAKNSNRIINGTKVSKKLTMEEHVDVGKVHKSWKTHVRNGMISKSKRQRNVWAGKKDRVATDAKDTGENDNDKDKDNGNGNGNGNYNDNDAEYSAVSSPASVKTSPRCDEQSEELSENDATVENIAERIKRRKVNVAEKTSNATSSLSVESVAGFAKRSTRKRKEDLEYATAEETVALRKKSRSNFASATPSRSKGTRGRRAIRATVDSEKSDSPVERNSKIGTRKSQRKGKRANGSCRRTEETERRVEKSTGNKCNYNSSESCDDPPECESENNNASESEENADKDDPSDDDVVNEQKRMERLVIQEKEDFELALRLQAKFDEMERIAGRTRRSRRAFESGAIEIDLYEIEIGRSVEKTENAHTAKRSMIDRTMNSEAKRRGRPSKQRVK